MEEVDPIIFHAIHKYMHEARFVHTPENEIGYAVYITLHKHTVWGHDGAIFHMSTDLPWERKERIIDSCKE